jgi:hypothetical protein
VKQNIELSGDGESRRIFIDGNELLPEESLKVINHSPDGFNWSYSGSGPAQLALAVCLKCFKKDVALKYYQKFKNDWIATLPAGSFTRSIPIAEWIWTCEQYGGDQ